MKIMTVLGTRPEIIRLARVIEQLDRRVEQHIVVHTGQNYADRLSGLFFREMAVREADVFLSVRAGSFGDQIGQILARIEPVLAAHRPDRMLILGDTNSGIAALVAARMGIPVYHMEAGNRCFDDRVPEEINRRVIDHCSTVLMPYTQRSKENLLREGIERHRVFVTGNPIFEVLQAYGDRIDGSEALSRLGLEEKGYLLATLHRAENVDRPERLAGLFAGLSRAADRLCLPLIVSVHPRTADRLRRSPQSSLSDRVRLIEPVGFFDFVKLERHARAVLSDSGTVQEECCILQVPNVTLRDVTERPETIECGSNILSGAAPEDIVRTLDAALSTAGGWVPPPEYLVPDVSRAVVKILTGYAPLAPGAS